MTLKQINKRRMQSSVLKYINVKKGKHSNYKHTIPYLSDGHDNDKDDYRNHEYLHLTPDNLWRLVAMD